MPSWQPLHFHARLGVITRAVTTVTTVSVLHRGTRCVRLRLCPAYKTLRDHLEDVLVNPEAMRAALDSVLAWHRAHERTTIMSTRDTAKNAVSRSRMRQSSWRPGACTKRRKARGRSRLTRPAGTVSKPRVRQSAFASCPSRAPDTAVGFQQALSNLSFLCVPYETIMISL